MASVTVNSVRNNVDGSYRELLYNITGTTGQTLATGLKLINAISWNDPANVTAATASGGTITFTGTMTNTLVRVLGL